MPTISEPFVRATIDTPTLRTIASPSIATLVSPRALDPKVAQALEVLTHQLGPEFSRTVHAATNVDLAPLFTPIPPGHVRDWLEADATTLLQLFRDLTGDPGGRVRLTVVSRDACRKFHVDQVGLRLLCTYAGPGTELLQRELEDRRVLAAKTELSAFNDAVVAAAGGARRASAGAVVLLKGERWPGNQGRGAVHRSPAIAESGQLRLVLKIDDVSPKRCAGSGPRMRALPA